MTRLRTRTTFGLSLPETVLKEIDADRGDINRSRYILRLIEKNSKNTIAQIHPKVCRPEGSVLPSTKGLGDPKPNG